MSQAVHPPAAGHDPKQPSGEEQEPSLEELQSRIEALEQQNQSLTADKEQWMQAALRRDTSASQPPARETRRQDPTFEPIGDPPDREKDEEAYNRWVEASVKRMDARDRALVAQQEQERQQRAIAEERNAMWDRFKSQYRDLAEHQPLVAAAFTIETNGTGNFSDPEPLFFKRVAERARSLGTSLAPSPSSEENEPSAGAHQAPEGFAPPAPQQAASPQKSVHRTAGVGVGSRLRSPAKPTDGRGDRPKTFSEELADQQAASGYF